MLEYNCAHFVGIGGIGMSAIARILLRLGVKVTGSDLSTSAILKDLEKLGAQIYLGHEVAHVGQADVVVVSSAVADDNPELVEAKKRGIPVLMRGMMLSKVMNLFQGVAVAGAHGKTTTTAMVGRVLEEAALDPTIVVGGVLKEVNSNAKLGHGRYLVAEADESDASFLELNPLIAVVTSNDADVNLGSRAFRGCGYDKDLIQTTVQGLFCSFVAKVKPDGAAVLCVDSDGMRAMMENLKSCGRHLITYGLTAEAHPDYTAKDIILGNYHSRSRIFHGDQELGELHLQVPGRHNIQDALAAIAVGMELGCSFAQCVRALASFCGVRRRFDIVGQFKGITVVDDYAHNPHKLKAAVHAACTGDAKRVFAVFQPHRYTRTKFFFEDYPWCFDGVDTLLITDIWSAGETPEPGITCEALRDKIASVSKARNIVLTPSHDDVWNFLKAHCQAGDAVIFLGAGDINKCAARACTELV